VYGDMNEEDDGMDQDQPVWRDRLSGSGHMGDTGKKKPPVNSEPLSSIPSGMSGIPALEDFVTAMAICHTCVVEMETGSLQSESPDEDALVQAAGTLGLEFVGRRNGLIIVERVEGVNVKGKGREEYELLATIPFDSDRKRMSVVVRRRSDNKVILICKGADNVILERAKNFHGE
jgi:magnesium-transporting ATPase (P-type)